MKPCPFCAEDIQDAAITCRYCGRNLQPGSWSGTLLLLGGVMLALLLLAAGSQHDDAATPTAETSVALAAARVQAATRDRQLRYFQRRLIEDGRDNLYSSFGSDMTLLGLSGIALQQMDVHDAYATAHAKTLQLSDAAERRRMLLELFDETEQ